MLIYARCVNLSTLRNSHEDSQTCPFRLPIPIIIIGFREFILLSTFFDNTLLLTDQSMGILHLRVVACGEMSWGCGFDLPSTLAILPPALHHAPV